MTITLLLVLAAFICSIANALGKCPTWVPLILLCVAMLVGILPK